MDRRKRNVTVQIIFFFFNKREREKELRKKKLKIILWLFCLYSQRITDTDVSKDNIKRITKMFTQHKTFSLS